MTVSTGINSMIAPEPLSAYAVAPAGSVLLIHFWNFEDQTLFVLAAGKAWALLYAAMVE